MPVKKSLPKFSLLKRASHGHRATTAKATSATTENGEDIMRIVPLGGLEEVGRNSLFIEYKNEIVIIDMGIEFPIEETPGIDFIIPNVAYLETKKENIKAVIITHGHLDHIGAY